MPDFPCDRTDKESSTFMTKRIALVHAVTAAMEPISDAFRELWPEAACSNILDDSLPDDLEKSGGLTPAIFGRFDTLGSYAADIGADGLCSHVRPSARRLKRSPARQRFRL
jgi:hypothetical protein